MSIRWPFFRRKKKSITKIPDNVPDHVAIIMDGNGRWAKQRGLPRVAGHKEGMDVVRDIVIAATEAGVKILTLYAFSTENWRRPKSEVDFLMKLPKEFMHIYLPEMIEKNVKIETIGEFNQLPDHTRKAIIHAKEETKNNDGLILNFALNYGSRHEIVEAVKEISTQVNQGKLDIEKIDEDIFSSYLYTKSICEPDLLIRTSGEIRLSNFLLWQLAYTELWFTDVLWPDFNEEHFKKALVDYHTRKRRYGGI
ncbi:MAG TPA: isoprenyl transferase [Pseudogracilibacillus sp.]|nr:isoprenyl transferase [Pseudogracilibacillus sp.]